MEMTSNLLEMEHFRFLEISMFPAVSRHTRMLEDQRTCPPSLSSMVAQNSVLEIDR